MPHALTADAPTPPTRAQPSGGRSTAVTDRLRSVYRQPGPYTSVYLQTRPLLHDPDRDLYERWGSLRAQLAPDAPPAALEAIDARLTLPRPEHTAGIGVIAAENGHAVVDHATDPPRRDLTRIDNLPDVGPMLEWDQHRVPHLVVTVDRTGADAVEFGADHRATVESVSLIGTREDLARALVDRAAAIDARLVVVAGDPDQRTDLAGSLERLVDPECRVVIDHHATVDDLADATVRHVSDRAARETVGLLREFRFMASHEAAVDGIDDTVEALVNGDPDLLLVHDDPDDERRVWIGGDPSLLAVEPGTGVDTAARFVDAAIRSAVVQDIAVHIIPTTGRHGPDDGAAVINRDGPTGNI